MKVAVDENHCQGHGLCFMTSPQVFALRDEDGTAYVAPGGDDPANEAAARAGADACPEQAITVTRD